MAASVKAAAASIASFAFMVRLNLPRVCAAPPKQQKTGFEPPLHFGHALEPNRVTRHIEWFEGMRFGRHDKAYDIAGKGLYADRPVPGWRRRDVDGAAVSAGNLRCRPRPKTLCVSSKPVCTRFGGKDPVVQFY